MLLLQEFWSEAGGDKAKALLGSIPKFEDAMRAFVIGVVAMTYQLIEKEQLELLLNLKGAALDAVCTDKGFKVQGSEVAIPVGDFNRASTKDISNPVTFEHDIAPIVFSAGL